jgi:hypothetical protein
LQKAIHRIANSPDLFYQVMFRSAGIPPALATGFAATFRH